MSKTRTRKGARGTGKRGKDASAAISGGPENEQMSLAESILSSHMPSADKETASPLPNINNATPNSLLAQGSPLPMFRDTNVLLYQPSTSPNMLQTGGPANPARVERNPFIDSFARDAQSRHVSASSSQASLSNLGIGAPTSAVGRSAKFPSTSATSSRRDGQPTTPSLLFSGGSRPHQLSIASNGSDASSQNGGATDSGSGNQKKRPNTSAGDEERKRRRKERNRLAAARCRQKKIDLESQLTTELAGLHQQYKTMSQQLIDTEKELAELKRKYRSKHDGKDFVFPKQEAASDTTSKADA